MSDIFMEKALKQDATYWGSPVTGGWGGMTFASPIDIKVRWEDKQELFIDALGDEVRSHAVIIVDRDLDLGGFIYLGESTATDPGAVDGAREIRATSKVPNMKGDKYVRRVWT